MWYTAKLLFRSGIPHGDGRVLEEVSYRLIRADDEAAARSKAAALGRAEQHEYENDQGEVVAWRFLEVAELQDLCEAEIRDGMEVFSRLRWAAAAAPAAQPD
jgi:hypothetical protein